MNELRVEQFKGLKEEYRQYLFYIQQLWRYKFVTLGLVMSAAVLNEKIIGNIDKDDNARMIAAVGFALMTAISMIIDMKTLEIGLHVRFISDFIRTHYIDVPEIHLWEKTVWSGSRLSRYRTLITLWGAIGTTLAVMLASLLICMRLMPEWKGWWITLAVVGFVTLLIFGMVFIPRLLKK